MAIKIDKEKRLGDQFIAYYRRLEGLPTERFLRLLAKECINKFIPNLSGMVVLPPEPKFPETVLMKEGKIIPEGKKKGKGK